MYQDSKLLLSGSISGTDNSITPQTITASAVSTNSIDLQSARDIGEGEDLVGRVIVQTAFAGLTSLQANVIVADDAALTVNVTIVGSSAVTPASALTQGAQLIAEINPLIGSLGRRYVGLQYVVVGTATAGAVIGDIGIEIQDGKKFYPSGFGII